MSLQCLSLYFNSPRIDHPHAAELGRASLTRVNAVVLEEHFIDRFRLALAPPVLSHRALVTDIDLGKKKLPLRLKHPP